MRPGSHSVLWVAIGEGPPAACGEPHGLNDFEAEQERSIQAALCRRGVKRVGMKRLGFRQADAVCIVLKTCALCVACVGLLARRCCIVSTNHQRISRLNLYSILVHHAYARSLLCVCVWL